MDDLTLSLSLSPPPPSLSLSLPLSLLPSPSFSLLSQMHEMDGLDLDDLNFKSKPDSYSSLAAYCRSKFAQVSSEVNLRVQYGLEELNLKAD